MTRSVLGNVVLAQACLLGGLLICVFLRPHGLMANDGISYYGIFWQTAVPYAIAVLGSGFFTRRALHVTAPASPAPMYVRGLATWLAVMSAGVVLTPYSANLVFDWVHTALGAALFFLQLVLGVQLVLWTGNDAWAGTFLLILFASGVFSAIFVLPKHGFLLQGQSVFQVAFAALVVRSSHRLVPEPVLQPC